MCYIWFQNLEMKLFLVLFWPLLSSHTTKLSRLNRSGSNHYSIPHKLTVNITFTEFCHNQFTNYTFNLNLMFSKMFYLTFHSCTFPSIFNRTPLASLLISLHWLQYLTTFYEHSIKNNRPPSHSSPFIGRLSCLHYSPFIGFNISPPFENIISFSTVP